MNLPSPCWLRGSLGSPAGRAGGGAAALAEPSGAGEGSGGAFSRPASLFSSLRGEFPLPSQRFPEPLLAHPSANPAGCRGPRGWRRLRSGAVSLPRLRPGVSPVRCCGRGNTHDREGWQSCSLGTQGRSSGDSDALFPWTPRSEPRLSLCLSRGHGSAAAPLSRLSRDSPPLSQAGNHPAARRGGMGCDGMGRAGAALGAPHRAGQPLCGR